MKAKILRTDAELFIIEQYLDELAAVADVVTTQSTDEDALALEATDAEIIGLTQDQPPTGTGFIITNPPDEETEHA